MNKQREIGGYIELENNYGREYHEKARAFNSARNCFAYLIDARKIRRIYLPYFLCDSIKEVCVRAEIEIEYYHIDKGLRPIFNKSLKRDEWLYFVNYYGQFSNEELKKYVIKFKNVIIDNVQSFFQMAIKGVDTIYTCRKYFGVPDGAYLYSEVADREEIPVDFSFNRIMHLAGRFEKTGTDFYKDYLEAEDAFVGRPILGMSKLSHNLLCGIDYERIIKARENNFSYLKEKLKEINGLSVNVPKGPFMYPLYVEQGDSIRKKLRENKIYVPILWPDVLTKCGENETEYRFAKNVLPLPVDQRYNREDMEYVVSQINRSIKEVECNEY